MSHRVTTQTEIKDKGIAIMALKKAGYSFSDEGANLRVTSGPMNRAIINLKTGEISGDTDYHSKSDDSLGALKQFYAEAKYTAEVQKAGGEVVERSVEKATGDVVLRVRVNFG